MYDKYNSPLNGIRLYRPMLFDRSSQSCKSFGFMGKVEPVEISGVETFAQIESTDSVCNLRKR